MRLMASIRRGHRGADERICRRDSVRNVLALAVLCGATLALSTGRANAQYYTLNDPNAVNGTIANGVYGDLIVGTYFDATNMNHGFEYNVASDSYSNFDVAGSTSTIISGINGTTITGSYTDINGTHGFISNADGTNFVVVDNPNDIFASTTMNGISTQYAVGNYTDPVFGIYPTGFIYDLSNPGNPFLLSLNDPNSILNNTVANGVDGDNVVGTYYDGTQNDGYVYNIITQTYTTINDPLGVNGTVINGIVGNDIVGSFIDGTGLSHGFEYDIATGLFVQNFTTLDATGANDGTFANGVSISNNLFNPNNVVVGNYIQTGTTGGGSNIYGFYYQDPVPEPGCLALIVGAGVSLVSVRRRRRSRA